MDGYETIWIERDGLSLALHVSQGDGPVVVLQHGLCGDASQPASVFPPSPPARHAVLECRGHGSSETGPFDQLSIATFADDLIAVIEYARIGPCIAGGISMGAAIAQRVAVLRPDLVSALILARPAWMCSAAPANMVPNLRVGEALRAPPRPGEAERFRDGEVGQTLAVASPDNLASLLGFFNRPDRAATAALLTQISCDGPGTTAAQLAQLQRPTLILANDQDAIHPIASGRKLAALIPNSCFCEITPKGIDRARYADDIKAEIRGFVQEVFDASR